MSLYSRLLFCPETKLYCAKKKVLQYKRNKEKTVFGKGPETNLYFPKKSVLQYKRNREKQSSEEKTETNLYFPKKSMLQYMRNRRKALNGNSGNETLLLQIIYVIVYTTKKTKNKGGKHYAVSSS